MNIETKYYPDGTTATGVVPLPAYSPAQLSPDQIMEAFQEAFPGHELHQESIDFARAVERMCRQASPRPPCAVCGTPYEKHGSYPTCASHSYEPSVSMNKTHDYPACAIF